MCSKKRHVHIYDRKVDYLRYEVYDRKVKKKKKWLCLLFNVSNPKLADKLNRNIKLQIIIFQFPRRIQKTTFKSVLATFDIIADVV